LVADAVGRSDLSGAAKADGDLAILDDHRDLAPAIGQLPHALKAGVVFQDIDIVEGYFAPGEVRTGSRSKGSKVLAVDCDVFCHNFTVCQMVNAAVEGHHQVKRGSIKLQVWLGLC